MVAHYTSFLLNFRTTARKFDSACPGRIELFGDLEFGPFDPARSEVLLMAAQAG
jgi:hypothetical protein